MEENLNEITPTIVYENRLVALIDVMGFQELLRKSEESLEILQKFYDDANEFLVAKGRLYEQTAIKDDFKKMFVSDSIILSVKLKSEEELDENLQIASRFFSAISLLQFLLAVKTKVWTRGAISVGELFMDEKKNILVGPAFVSAYSLEKKADYPRVIIDPRVCKEFGLVPAVFIERINSMGFSAHLIGPNPMPRIGSYMVNDAIQLDWFRQAFDRVENTTRFFDDLKVRISANQELLEKSHKLLKYLRESLASFKMAKRDANFEQKISSIENSIKDFGY